MFSHVIFTLPDGRKLTMEELQGVTGRVSFHDGKLLDVTGTVRYEVIGTRTISRRGQIISSAGTGKRGGAAITRKPSRLLERASERAPEWALPRI